jgi:uncharacterized protein YvpB
MLATAPMTADAAMIRLPVGTQRMQMPLDCEAASLTIALASVGVHTTQQYVQSHFPTDTRAPILGANGLPARWGDPYVDFVGHVMGSEPGSNPHWTSYPGWGAYAPVVAHAAEALGVPVAAQLTGWNPQALYAAVEAGHPVLVWSTVNYSSQIERTWVGWDGRIVPWTQAGHVVVLMGVNPTSRTLEFSDPLTGSYNGTTMAQFARTFTIYGDMAVVIERTARGLSHPLSGRRIAPPVHHPRPAPGLTPTARPLLRVPLRHADTWDAFSSVEGVDGATNLLTDASAVSTRGGSAPAPLIALGAMMIAMAAALFGLLLRRRRQCAG